MNIDGGYPEQLWRYYQRGYDCLIRNGLYFRQVVRPALSHVFFQRTLPLLTEYARANQTNGDLPPGFRDQMEACPLSTRDLLHLDYAICLGYVLEQGKHMPLPPVMAWPGPSGFSSILITADAETTSGPVQPTEEPNEATENAEDDNDDSGFTPPFDL